MENASKALIIAGAILISIVLISIGMVIVGRAQGMFDRASTSMNQQEKQLFNAQFQSYEGRQSGTQVKALITQIIASNNQYYEKEGETVTIEFEGITSSSLTAASPIKIEEPTAEAADQFSTQAANLRININTGAKYDVTLVTAAATGLINTIKIVKAQ